MHQPVILVAGILRNALAMKSRKQRSRAGPVKTLIVVKDTYVQSCNRSPDLQILSNQESSRIAGTASHVKGLVRPDIRTFGAKPLRWTVQLNLFDPCLRCPPVR